MLFKNSEMESRNKFEICRLCLCENECFVNIFEMNDWQGYVAAEVISDLLLYQVSEDDGYPHVVCLTCLTKLTDFRQFKECCQKSKDTYNKMIASRECLVDHKPEMPIIKEEELNIDSSGDISDETFEGTNTKASFGPILLKNEVLSFNRDSSAQETLIESEAFGNADAVEQAAIQDSTQVHLTPVDTGTHPQYLQSDWNTRDLTVHSKKQSMQIHAQGTSSPVTDSYLWNQNNISVSVEVEASSSATMEKLEGQRISPGDGMCLAALFQGSEFIGKKEIDVAGEMEGTATKVVEGEQERLECYHCGNVFTSKSGLKLHMVLHGFSKSFDCEVCGKAFHSNENLKIHVLTHAGQSQYKCAQCSKSCNLEEHMRTHTDSKPYKCAECLKSFSQNNRLKCPECSKCFAQNGDFRRHLMIHAISKPYKCAECSKCFSQYDRLKIHMSIHTGSKPYKCAECGKCFARNGDFNKHLRVHTGFKPYKCTVCSKCFTYSGNLKEHMRTHTGSQPYKCMECGKCFSKNCNLKVHMNIHTGSKPFKCTECGKKFSVKSSLRKHETSHTGCKHVE